MCICTYLLFPYPVIRIGEKVACGSNMFLEKGGKTLHAEISALEKFSSRRDPRRGSVNILVIRVGFNGQLKMSKPCCECMKKLKSIPIKIKNIYYSDEQGKIVCEKFSKMK